MCLKVIKRVENYHENSSLGMDALANMLKKMTPQNEDSSTQWVENRKPSSSTTETMWKQKISWRNESLPQVNGDELSSSTTEDM